MITQQDAKNIIDQVISYSKLPECSIDLNWTEDDFIRFANNGITTSGYRITQSVSISSTTADKRSGNAAVGELTPEALKRGVDRPNNWQPFLVRIPKICRRCPRNNIRT